MEATNVADTGEMRSWNQCLITVHLGILYCRTNGWAQSLTTNVPRPGILIDHTVLHISE